MSSPQGSNGTTNGASGAAPLPLQQALAQSMRAAWTSFAAHGAPTAWPPFNRGESVMSLVPRQPQLLPGFVAAHHCDFWSHH